MLSAARLQEDNLRARHGRRSVCIGTPGKDKRSAWERREWRSTNLGAIRRLSVSRRRRAILQIIRWGGYVNVSIFRPQSSSFPARRPSRALRHPPRRTLSSGATGQRASRRDRCTARGSTIFTCTRHRCDKGMVVERQNNGNISQGSFTT